MEALLSTIEIAALPLPGWPSEPPYEHEPAHWYFLRLARENHYSSASTLAYANGLNGNHMSPTELLDFCIQFPIRHRERLLDAAPRFDGKIVTVNNQRFNLHNDWSIAQPRVCGACLGEKRYYRNWWDITALHHCPLHDRPLVSGGSSDRLSRWHTEIGVTPSGHSLVEDACRVAGTVHKWEQYVLGRMGILPATHIQHLDGVEMHEITNIVDFLGRITIFGARSGVRRLKKYSSERASTLKLGATVLLDGPDAIRRHIEQVLNSNSAGWSATDIQKLFYPLSDKRSPFASAIAELANQAIDSTRVYSRRGPKRRTTTGPRPLSIKKIAAELGMAKRHVLALAVKLGLTPREVRHGVQRPLPPDAVTAVREVASQLVSRDLAAKMLGLSIEDFETLRAAADLEPFIRLGNGLAHDQFRRPEILAIITQVRKSGVGGCQESLTFENYCRLVDISPGRVAAEIFSGRVMCIGWANNGQGFGRCILPAPTRLLSSRGNEFKARPISLRPGLGKSDAASRIGVRPAIIKHLIAEGFLKLLDADAKLPRIDEHSLEAFCNEFAPSYIYAEVINCPKCQAVLKLESLGVKSVPRERKCGNTFVKRVEARAALGITQDPDTMAPDEVGEFWLALDRHLGEQKSCMRLYQINSNCSTRITAGTRMFSAIVTIDLSNAAFHYEIDCSPAKASRRFQNLQAVRPEISSEWFARCVAEDSERKSVTVHDSTSLDLSRRASWSTAFCWLDDQMEFMRLIFSRLDSEYPHGRKEKALASRIQEVKIGRDAAEPQQVGPERVRRHPHPALLGSGSP